MPSLSLIFPAFNEAGNLPDAVSAASGVLDEIGADWEIIVVDDGSTDDTWMVAMALARQDGRIRPVRHAVNGGYGAALRTGFGEARWDLVFFTDADLQFDLAELPALIPLVERYDIVAGYRASRQDPGYRRLNAWAWGRAVRALFGLEVVDVNCAFKLFRRSVLSSISLRSAGAFINTELLVRARSAGCSLHQVPVSHFPRARGEQTGANPAVILRAFVELGEMYRELRLMRRFSRAEVPEPEREVA